jgi:hypothetical protein
MVGLSRLTVIFFGCSSVAGRAAPARWPPLAFLSVMMDCPSVLVEEPASADAGRRWSCYAFMRY